MMKMTYLLMKMVKMTYPPTQMTYLLMLCQTLILPSSTSCFSHTSTAFLASSLSSVEAECLRKVYLQKNKSLTKEYAASLPS